MNRPPEKLLVATDVVVLTAANPPEVILIQRKNEPFKEAWALPGGFLEPDEDIITGALRELREETGITLLDAQQIGVYGKPGRDPRGRVISIAYAAVVDKNTVKPQAADDAKHVAWHLVTHLPAVAFDHVQIISDALASRKNW